MKPKLRREFVEICQIFETDESAAAILVRTNVLIQRSIAARVKSAILHIASKQRFARAYFETDDFYLTWRNLLADGTKGNVVSLS